jgi:hypothetical protein
MASIAYALRRLIELMLLPLDRLPALGALTLLALMGGVGLLFVVGHFSSPTRVGRARDRLSAGLYEIRLFWDAPAQMGRALGRALVWAGRYLGLLTPAVIVISGPLALVYLHLEVRYGTAPLAVGVPALVRVTLAADADGRQLAVDAPGRGLAVTAPPLVLAAERRVYLRVVPQAPGRHHLLVRLGSKGADKEVAAGPLTGRVSAERVRGAAVLLALGHEPPLGPGPIERIEVLHGERPQRWLGLALPWWLYALILSTGIALLVKRRAGVVL